MLGGRLFEYAFGERGEVLNRYRDCVAVAPERGERLRIALTVLAEELLGVPWEYMHDGESFILKQNQSIVRVIDELRAMKAPFGPIRRLLVAIANPKNSAYKEFDAEAHRKELEGLIGALRGVEADFLMPATKKALRDKLSDNDYDTLYFVGHGRFSPGLGGQIILEKPPQAAATTSGPAATNEAPPPRTTRSTPTSSRNGYPAGHRAIECGSSISTRARRPPRAKRTRFRASPSA